jgi:hypothetical protein
MDNQASKTVPPESAIPRDAGIPDGFVRTVGPDGERIIVPEYLFDATHQAFAGYYKRVTMDVKNEPGGVSLGFQ